MKSQPSKSPFVVALLLVAAGVMGWLIYGTLWQGTTAGPDFIHATQSGGVSGDRTISIEVVEPPVGHTPFETKEYDGLPRLMRIADRATIDRIFSLLKEAQPGKEQQNHPVNTYNVYLKVNVQEGFYWIYCNAYQDEKSSVLVLDANTLNATNPNGSIRYQLGNFSDLIAIITPPPPTKQFVPANNVLPSAPMRK